MCQDVMRNATYVLYLKPSRFACDISSSMITTCELSNMQCLFWGWGVWFECMIDIISFSYENKILEIYDISYEI